MLNDEALREKQVIDLVVVTVADWMKIVYDDDDENENLDDEDDELRVKLTMVMLMNFYLVQ